MVLRRSSWRPPVLPGFVWDVIIILIGVLAVLILLTEAIDR